MRAMRTALREEMDDYRRLERVCREVAERAVLPETRRTLLVMAERYRTAAAAIEQSSRFANTVPTQVFRRFFNILSKPLNLLGERGGTRTHDPMIKSHVLYRLSYALTHLSNRS
jgi:hypothetical protein